MSLIIDKKFINMVSPMLPKFAWKKENLANCRCPICGDSKKNKSKARGFFFAKNNDMFYRCHNCGVSTTMYKFLESVSPALCKEYSLERWKNGENGNSNYKKPEFKFEQPKFNISDDVLDGLKNINELDKDHPCRKFVEDRKIPEQFYSVLYYTDDFGSLANKLDPEVKLEKEPRLVIPVLNTKNRVIAMQGRTLSKKKSSIRYITIKADKEIERLWYGFCRLTDDKKYFVVEGPLDSLFLDNCVAMIGLNDGSQIPDPLKKKELIFVIDNEPRNKQVISQIEKLINNGRTVCILQNNIEEKDINDMILNGYGSEELKNIINQNAYSGIEAKLKLQQWKKV
jgi:hypothetical protein